VGKSILESYSRVLESLASNIIARIDDLLNVDELSKQSDHLPAGAGAGADGKIICKSISSRATTVVPSSGTPYATAYATPSFSPAQLSSPSKIGRALLVDRRPHHGKGAGAKRATTPRADRAGGVEVVKGMLLGSSAVFDIPTAAVATEL
jgi:hypothetical protein